MNVRVETIGDAVAGSSLGDVIECVCRSDTLKQYTVAAGDKDVKLRWHLRRAHIVHCKSAPAESAPAEEESPGCW
jgi:hypothetical protein